MASRHLILALSVLAPASAVAGPTFTVRTHDAIARPGHTAAVVLSTYEPMPIEDGQLCFRAGPSGILPYRTVVLSEQSDAAVLLSQSPAGDLVIQFSSPTASINASDGPMVSMYFDVPGGAAPGTVWDLTLDPTQSFLTNAAGLRFDVEARNGELQIVGRRTPFLLAAEADRVAPGEWAQVSIETLEPMRLAEGEFELLYDPSITDRAPRVRARSKTTDLRLFTDVSQPGRVRVRVVPTTRQWNVVPGALVDLLFHTPSGIRPGTTSTVRLDPAGTRLRRVDGGALPLRFESDDIEIR